MFFYAKEWLCNEDFWANRGQFDAGKNAHVSELEPETSICKWLFQLDDEPNLYKGNGPLNIYSKLVVWIEDLCWHGLSTSMKLTETIIGAECPVLPAGDIPDGSEE